MNMAMYFRFPFGTGGDRTTIDDTDPGSGVVNYTDGYGSDYEIDPVTPGAKRIERQKFNELMYEATLAIQQYQQLGAPDFITPADNGGVAFSYAINALVRYDDGGGFKVYRSLTDSNSSLPDTAANWLDTTSYLTSGSAVETLTTTVSQGLTVNPTSGNSVVELDLSGLSTEPTVSGATTVAIATGGANRLATNASLVSSVVTQSYVNGLNVNADTLDGLQATAFVQGSRSVLAGYGMSGGGTLSSDVTLAVDGGALTSGQTIVAADEIAFADDSDSDTLKTGTTGSLKNALGVQLLNNNTFGGNLAVTGNITATGSITAAFVSDKRLKDFTEDLDPDTALDFVDRCKVGRFTWSELGLKMNPDAKPGKSEIGFIAQEFKELYPEISPFALFDDDGRGGSRSGDDWLSMIYDKTPAVAFAAIKALLRRVEYLEGNGED